MPDTDLILDAQVFLEAHKALDPRELGAKAVYYLGSGAELVYRLFCAYLTAGLSDRLVSDIRSSIEQYQTDEDWIDQAHQDGFLSDAMDMLTRVLVELGIEETAPSDHSPLLCDAQNALG